MVFRSTRGWQSTAVLFALTLFAVSFAVQPVQTEAQSTGSQTQNPPANQQSSQDIPDAPSTVQPPPKPLFPPEGPAIAPAAPAGQGQGQGQNQGQSQNPNSDSSSTPRQPAPGDQVQSPAQTGTPKEPRNQLNPAENLYTIIKPANFVEVPVMVKDLDGRRVDGLGPKDFTVNENGREQTLTFFSSDPLLLSVAVIIDTGMSDDALQKVNQTYSSLIGNFSPYDEVSLYTYSSTVSQLADFTQRQEKLTGILNQLKVVRGRNNGPAVLSGPFAAGPSVNGMPVGGPAVEPVNTPPRESYVLNDAILEAAVDLSKRPKERRKVIFVISDGREIGSHAKYTEVLRVLETRDIQVKAVVLDTGALPGYKQVEKLHHVFRQGYSDILPKYAAATGGGQVYGELTRISIEQAYQSITSDARNQYTLGYIPLAITGAKACRTIEVIVHHRGLKVTAKDAYCPVVGQ
jgi:VWFA-related protein